MLSTMTCALLPPIPNELIDILSVRLLGQGVGFTGTTSLFFSKATRDFVSELIQGFNHEIDGSFNLLLGFGTENLIFGGIILCSNESTALIRLVRLLAPSE
jgi:hypothetical protein